MQRLDASLKPFASHLSPHLPVLPHREERLEPPPHRPLAISVVLEGGIQEQERQVADAAVAAKADFLEHDRPQRQEHAVSPRDEDEEQCEGAVDLTECQARERDHVTHDLDQRRQRFAEGEERHRDQPDRPVPWVEEHALIQPHRRDKAAVPALPLARQDPARLRHFRPRHGIGDERDLVGNAPLPQVAVQSHDQIEVLHDARHAVTADRVEVLLAEQPERAGDDQAAAQPIPAQPAEQKCPQILDDLNAGRKRRGTRASVTRPSRTVQPFATRTVPPTAAILLLSRNGRVRRSRASGSIRVSASTAMTSGKRLALMAALRESAFPPFSLSMTSSRVRERERYTARTRLVAIPSGYVRGTSYSSNACSSRSSVSSLEPSLTTTTSKLRYSSVRIAVTLVSIVALSLWAGTRIVIGGSASLCIRRWKSSSSASRVCSQISGIESTSSSA